MMIIMRQASQRTLSFMARGPKAAAGKKGASVNIEPGVLVLKNSDVEPVRTISLPRNTKIWTSTPIGWPDSPTQK